MSWLSEESLLIAENWDTVESILRARSRLASELSQLLLSVESELTQHDWWQDGWRFIQHRKDQVYISRQQWRPRRSFVIWIGVEQFSPERVFGESSSPQLYVWVQKWHRDLGQVLADAIEEQEGDPLGEVDHNKTGYVIRQDLQSCLPEEVGAFDDVARGQIVDFFVHYAEVLSELDDVIQGHISGSTPAG
jgi:hypothetical protein